MFLAKSEANALNSICMSFSSCNSSLMQAGNFFLGTEPSLGYMSYYLQQRPHNCHHSLWSHPMRATFMSPWMYIFFSALTIWGIYPYSQSSPSLSRNHVTPHHVEEDSHPRFLFLDAVLSDRLTLGAYLATHLRGQAADTKKRWYTILYHTIKGSCVGFVLADGPYIDEPQWHVSPSTAGSVQLLIFTPSLTFVRPVSIVLFFCCHFKH